MAININKKEGDKLRAEEWNELAQEVMGKQPRLNIVDDLNSDSSVDVLSAKQGKVLDEKINSATSTINGISEKVNKLPTGYYYGQADSVSGLPDASQLTQKGYAYVASENPSIYYIYLFDGEGSSWEDSGNKFVTTDLEDDLSTKSETKAPTTKVVAESIEEVDLTKAKTASTELTSTQKYNVNANISNRIADVEDVTDVVKALGYKVLNPNLSFAEQVNEANTIYEIKDEFDLGGGSVTIPAGCILKFNGGKLSNGTITGTNTVIDGKMLFKEITFDGSYVCKNVSSKDFEYATDDDALTAVFQFLNCIKKDVVCELENKTYDIDYKSSISGNTIFSKWKLDNCSNITINGNGAVLNHANPLTDTQQGLAQLNSILKLNSCTYITIKELTYQRLDGYDTNYQEDCDGICVIFFEGNNSFLDISMTAKNARSTLGNHIYAPAQTNHIGLVSDSVFNVKQYHTGYGVTFSWIANSKINVESHGQHRGVFLTGASNCDVYLEWEDQWLAPIACIISSSWTGGSDNLVFHACKDLNITSICTQKIANANDATVTKYCAGFGAIDELDRNVGLTHQNINIVTGNLHGIGGGFGADLHIAPSSTDSTIKDYYKNITIKTQSNQTILLVAPRTRVLENFNIYDSKVSDFRSDISSDVDTNTNISDSSISFVNSYIKHAYIGKGTYYFNKTDINELSDNNSLSSIADTKIFFSDCFIITTSNLTVKATIVSNMLPYKEKYYWPFSVLYSGTNCDVSRVMMPNYRANALNYGKLLIQTSNNGTSANRPKGVEDRKTGVMYFDTTLKKPIWYNRTAWVDANGDYIVDNSGTLQNRLALTSPVKGQQFKLTGSENDVYLIYGDYGWLKAANGTQWSDDTGTLNAMYDKYNYTLLTEEPSNWATAYNTYYKIVDNVYTKLTTLETWAEDTYYKKDVNVNKGIQVKLTDTDAELLNKVVKWNGTKYINIVDNVALKAGTPTITFTTENNITTATITSTSSGKIYYTKDGSTPTSSSTEYSSAITLTDGDQVKAICIRDHMDNSAPGFVPVSVPVITFSSAGILTITCETPNAKIYYTIDGNNPSTSSTEYDSSASVTIAKGVTVKAFAVLIGLVNSAVESKKRS